jgi:hypothetical protein
LEEDGSIVPKISGTNELISKEEVLIFLNIKLSE